MENNYHYNPHIKPGVLEIYCGPMKSGKTRELINRVDKLNYIEDCKFNLFKPLIDTRDKTVKSRFGELSYECSFVNEKTPYGIINRLGKETKLVAIDEAHFFGEGIEKIIEILLKKDINVILAGLDLDFRGEPFGQMPTLLAMAHEVKKLTAICEYNGCSTVSTRTQRLVDGKPAPYNSPIILVGDSEEGYETRCLKHHQVPGHPNKE
tara:strand:- start:41 stop:664 length:624 start_codon:yes stop_codon:yes gene_type:complete